MSGWFTSFFNCRQCIDGKLVEDQLVVSDDTGKILERTGYIGGDAVDLEGMIVAPGFIDLQALGLGGFHFSVCHDEESYARSLDHGAHDLPSQGVTSFYANLPYLSRDQFQKVLPSLRPREIPDSASLLGAASQGLHCETLASDPSLPILPMIPTSQILKLVTVSPELPSSSTMIQALIASGVKVSLGNSMATYEQGLAALSAGATCVSHPLGAMDEGFDPRYPGLTGLVTYTDGEEKLPFYIIAPDGQRYLHPSIVPMLFRAAPERCIIATCGGVNGERFDYVTLGDCVKNVMKWSGCGVAEAVRCVTENVVEFMGDKTRGKLEAGRRADLVVLDDEGNVLETWIAGRKVWEKKGGWR